MTTGRSLLTPDADPLDVLCHHFNVGRAILPAGPLPATFDLAVLRDAHMPSHLLAVYQTNGYPPGPVLMPIDATLYDRAFRIDLNLPPCQPGSTAPVPHLAHPASSSSSKPQLLVTLPVVTITVPNITSLPLLLLFALSLETHLDTLAYRLLPRSAVSEFPSATAMAGVVARVTDSKAFEKLSQQNFGMWGNMLALGLREGRVEEVVRLCWNVTAEAKRIRGYTGI